MQQFHKSSGATPWYNFIHDYEMYKKMQVHDDDDDDDDDDDIFAVVSLLYTYRYMSTEFMIQDIHKFWNSTCTL